MWENALSLWFCHYFALWFHLHLILGVNHGSMLDWQLDFHFSARLLSAKAFDLEFLPRCCSIALNSPAVSCPNFQFAVRRYKNIANEGNDLRVGATVLLERGKSTMNRGTRCCVIAGLRRWVEGKVPPPVEGGAAVGDHLVKVPKDQNQRVETATFQTLSVRKGMETENQFQPEVILNCPLLEWCYCCHASSGLIQTFLFTLYWQHVHVSLRNQ